MENTDAKTVQFKFVPSLLATRIIIIPLRQPSRVKVWMLAIGSAFIHKSRWPTCWPGIAVHAKQLPPYAISGIFGTVPYMA